MFDAGYPFTKLNHSRPKPIGEYNVIEHTYAFRGKTGKRYIAIAEEYNYFTYIIKFCLQERKIHEDRFTRLSRLNECSRVLTTIGQIIKELYQKNPYASFGFIGSPLPEEAKENTKRFKLYSKVVRQVVSPVAFEHRESAKHSAYVLINRDNPEENLLKKMEKMFDKIYLLN
ncbi:hypothetical protein LZZ85_00815 [Terrimonas sp. NA20]|uniref:Uncharacterized protein n=1 Tax=Terrimonas ginsenosidimutans TaxID=2908004 RepID=A0ABS9KKD9_9BACT|nr:hypothetical protein [Terrimonas ginsenosidimutans]MCG2612792.1 hypothetical protein [Terrimonas ginsenosidimutans]